LLSSDIDAWSLGGSYDFGVAKLLAGYRSRRLIATGENKRNGYYVAVTAPVGPGTVRASYNRYENKSTVDKGKADQFAVGYVYNLSKRTSVYGTYAYIKNKDGANGCTTWAPVV
jgi:predicted porin